MDELPMKYIWKLFFERIYFTFSLHKCISPFLFPAKPQPASLNFISPYSATARKIRNSNHMGSKTTFLASLRTLLGLQNLISISVIAFATSLGCSRIQLNRIHQSVSGVVLWSYIGLHQAVPPAIPSAVGQGGDSEGQKVKRSAVRKYLLEFDTLLWHI